ncbi:NAD-dependent epimerase/dehydratase family protein [Motilimonas pumila]|uniref:NAD-dependent epimerase/dehydratase family protein n=1 Tax=Motilimonas pumila TaxID=2303987 RepID=A0A418YE01_9GAMM|nr:NAD-dependent epimerase/dehydratase family protein [Motilimonas pumila]RJG42704.1 NAD-dependent epimerase/dehydratase family protein [Motilimonas pumila]
MKKLNWLITGGLGFVGRTLIAELLKQDLAQAIRVVDNFSTGSPSDLQPVTDFSLVTLDNISAMSAHSGIEVVKADIRDAEPAVKVTAGADVIIHLAANTGVQPSIESPRLDMESNVMGTLNYLEAARQNQIKQFVLASSGAPIGEAEPPITEKSPCRPISPYGASKLAGEAYCSAYNGSFGINTIVLRFSNVYGPLSGKKGSVVAKFIKQALAGETWTINGNGEQTRDFIYSQDLAKAVVKAAYHPKGGEIFQVATQEETSVRELADLLSAQIKEVFELEVTIDYGEPLIGDVARNFADITHSKQVLGWQPEVKLATGIVDTLNWFREKNK